MVKVSIVVPVYNASKYLKTCLDSLVNQTIDDMEIIAIDDASLDNSLDILKDYAKNYLFLKVYSNEKNMGQGWTRNKGISLASGEYIGFLDADDYVNINMYKTMYEAAILNNRPDIIVTSLKFVTDDFYAGINYERDLKGRLYNINENPDMVIYESPSCCNKLFKKDLINDYYFISGVMWEDVAFTYSMLIKADNMLRLNNLDYFYRRDINRGVSGQNYKVNLRVFDIIKVAFEIEKEAKKSGKYDIFKSQVKFLQMATCLQRVSEIEMWKTDKVLQIKEELYKLILENFGNLDDVDKALLSSRVSLDVIGEFDEYCKKYLNNNYIL